MNISKNKVVTFDYTLKNNGGDILDTSDGKKPLSYLHGNGFIVPGLEKALEGKIVGDSFSVLVKAEEGYGNYNPGLIFDVDKKEFSKDDDIQVGTQVQMQSENGIVVLTVKSIEGDNVKLDANHPLAGQDLNFDIEIKEVREATEEELSHGHAHGDGHEHS